LNPFDASIEKPRSRLRGFFNGTKQAETHVQSGFIDIAASSSQAAGQPACRNAKTMKRLLMAFTAIAAVAGPLAAPLQALAQDATEQPAPRRERPDRGANRPDRPAMTRETQPRFERPARPDVDGPRPDRPQGGWNRPDRPNGGQRPERPEGGWNRPDRPNAGGPRPERPEGGWNRPDRPNTGGTRPDRPDAGAPRPDRPTPGGQRPDRPEGGWNRPDRPGPGGGRPDRSEGGWNRPDRPNPGGSRPGRPDGGWNRPDRPDGWNRPNRPRPDWNNDRERERLRREFRQRFDAERWRRDFYRNHRADWWRNDNRFRGYDGFRAGFYFAPGWGYYSVPRSYWGRNWSVGQYLPEAFWRYQLQDWRTYGLGYPPAGTRWVSVDNSLYLIDEYDGYIVDVVRDAWRW